MGQSIGLSDNKTWSNLYKAAVAWLTVIASSSCITGGIRNQDVIVIVNNRIVSVFHFQCVHAVSKTNSFLYIAYSVLSTLL